MKLLLDEMWPAETAIQLRNRGHDVEAVQERQVLRGQPDSVIFAYAQVQERTVVTENIADFRPLAAQELQRGHAHAGLIFTSNRRFPRHDPRTIGRVVTALDAQLSTDPHVSDREHWLS